ncbi:acyl-CoA carboxylase epsilon subunit [Actinacidiphila alni]|uniref:Acyl-CoA carboxylase epsilon subunit n=1 Tax=Actinacidiphila alni TaxID=380248 RepID=A0A1I2LUQ9_9ACTN|nr:acyl-CoA carboxylase epsilon subunit [Actinacidiphila alni]SFF80751.1 Acyl-CoA carboxylase epsilon subunit [Actinacidiphila alni]
MVEIKVERGTPTAEELAAVVALVQARAAAAGSGAADGPAPLDSWADPARNVPAPVPAPGPGAWRASAWPA